MSNTQVLEQTICEKARQVVDARRANYNEPPRCFGGRVLDEREGEGGSISVTTPNLRVALNGNTVRNRDGSFLEQVDYDNLVTELEHLAEMSRPMVVESESLAARVKAITV